MKLPRARGSLSAALIEMLNGDGAARAARLAPDDDEDLHLTLFVCYELAYRGWDGVDDRWEWDGGLLHLRAAAERRFEGALHQPGGAPSPVEPRTVPARLRELAEQDSGPSLSGYLRGRATY